MSFSPASSDLLFLLSSFLTRKPNNNSNNNAYNHRTSQDQHQHNNPTYTRTKTHISHRQPSKPPAPRGLQQCANVCWKRRFAPAGQPSLPGLSPASIAPTAAPRASLALADRRSILSTIPIGNASLAFAGGRSFAARRRSAFASRPRLAVDARIAAAMAAATKVLRDTHLGQPGRW